MSWNANNSPSNSGYSLEPYNQYPTVEESSATISGVSTKAPNRSQMISATAAPHPNNQTQQGSATLASAPGIAGQPNIQWYKWQ